MRGTVLDVGSTSVFQLINTEIRAFFPVNSGDLYLKVPAMGAFYQVDLRV